MFQCSKPLFWSFEFLSFDIVSDFVLRISDFPYRRLSVGLIGGSVSEYPREASPETLPQLFNRRADNLRVPAEYG